ncbi:inositol phosphorylceramide synthase [Rhodococcus opacus]|nr:inositol phosphorylceramide synthase [Rhodococcus opacus]
MAPGPPDSTSRVGARRAVWCAYLLALAVTIYTLGLPTDRIYQATWIVVGLVAFTIDRPWQEHLRVVRDWLPLVAALVVYDLSRGFAYRLGMPVRAEELVSVESWLFGGAIPTVWLQEHLIAPTGELPWWTLLTGIVYTSHFIVPWVVAAVFYVYSRSVWSAYMRRVLLLSYLGLVTYILLPSVPPWLAAEGDVISGSVGRVAGFGFGVVPTDVSTRWLEAQSNPVAALPSLHAGFALLVAVALWPFAKNVWLRALLAAYPLAMAFVLVYGGEHYVVDVVAGWAYVGLATLLARAWEARTTALSDPVVTVGRPRRRW